MHLGMFARKCLKSLSSLHTGAVRVAMAEEKLQLDIHATKEFCFLLKF